jgi:GNAT superfamily N-acetyltransferase
MNDASAFSSSFSQAVTKTALDAIHAKHSAMMAGYGMVVDHGEVYRDLLQRICPKHKRQTPLVNAGYASRVLALSHLIHSFLAYHQVMPSPSGNGRRRRKVQIVLLGCGVDVLGVWAAIVSPSLEVTVIEIDMPEVCHNKREILERGALVSNIQEQKSGSNLTCYRGEIPCTNEEADTKQSYIMIPCDLRDTITLNAVLHDASIPLDAATPTLFLSELVLAYLPSTDTDQLLSWCATRFEDCALIALEPLGFDGSRDEMIIGVEEGYRRDYCQKFQNKMARGQKNTEDDKILFHPIGTSMENVTDRLKQAGFDQASTTTLGVAATLAAEVSDPGAMMCPEVFDEHAALSLHLRSYVVTCGMSRGSNNDEFFCRILCPWEVPSAIDLARAGLPAFDWESKTVIMEVQIQDEASVRSMFQSAYQEYMVEYPAIRKMVKGVLNRELRENTHGNTLDKDTSSPFLQQSSISEHYRASNGIFLVAIKYSEQNVGSEDRCCFNRTVVGFVGVQSCLDKTVKPGTMEIFRLMVDPECRGQGIAKWLLQTVERYAADHHCSMLIAKTPTILEPALRCYASCGYHMEREEPLGPKLILSTLVKNLDEYENSIREEYVIDTVGLNDLVALEDMQDSADVDYLGYEEAAPTVQQQRQRRGSLLGHIQAWAGAVNQEHLDYSQQRQGDYRPRPAPDARLQNRRGSMDAAVTVSPWRRRFHSSDELENEDEAQAAYHENDDTEALQHSNQYRRNSLDAMVEQAVAYVNLQPSPMDDDLDPFGSRRDSLF